MIFRDEYKEYFDRHVKEKEFPRGCLEWLYLPDKVKQNQKICSPFYGQYVVLEHVGDYNCVIQHITTKKTKFVNVNNLRLYDIPNSRLLPRTNDNENNNS